MASLRNVRQCSAVSATDRQNRSTDRQTTQLGLTIGRIDVRSTAMWHNNNNSLLADENELNSSYDRLSIVNLSLKALSQIAATELN